MSTTTQADYRVEVEGQQIRVHFLTNAARSAYGHESAISALFEADKVGRLLEHFNDKKLVATV